MIGFVSGERARDSGGYEEQASSYAQVQRLQVRREEVEQGHEGVLIRGLIWYKSGGLPEVIQVLSWEIITWKEN
jgi:hypothetical protein